MSQSGKQPARPLIDPDFFKQSANSVSAALAGTGKVGDEVVEEEQQNNNLTESQNHKVVKAQKPRTKKPTKAKPETAVGDREPISVNITRNTYRRLKIYAAVNDKYIGDVAEEAFLEFLKKYGQQ